MVHSSTLITQATPYLQSLLSTSQKHNLPQSLLSLISKSQQFYSENIANGLLSSPEQWWFLLHTLRNLAQILRPRNVQEHQNSGESAKPFVKILEIGSFTGCASLLMAREPYVESIMLVDVDDKALALAESAFKEEGIAEKFKYFVGPGKHIMDKLLKKRARFDFIFIDADKQQYDSYYEKALELLVENGIMIVDNVLWRGQVWDEKYTDETTEKMRAFNRKVMDDERVDSMLMPIGDGMYSVRKLSEWERSVSLSSEQEEVTCNAEPQQRGDDKMEVET